MNANDISTGRTVELYEALTESQQISFFHYLIGWANAEADKGNFDLRDEINGAFDSYKNLINKTS